MDETEMLRKAVEEGEDVKRLSQYEINSVFFSPCGGPVTILIINYFSTSLDYSKRFVMLILYLY